MTDSPNAHLHITLSTSSPFISLSQPSSQPFQLITTAHLVSSKPSSSPVTICTDRSVLDNGNHSQHDGLFRGAFQPLQSTSDPERLIPLAPSCAPPSYAYPDISPNLRERPWMRFETVPAVGKGDLEIRHDLSIERMFKNSGGSNSSGINLADVKPREKFRVRMTPRRVTDFIWWWTIGGLEDELKEKKFAKWQLPNNEGKFGDLMPGEDTPDVENMEADGWIFSERLQSLKVSSGTEEGIVFEFVK